MSKYVSGKKKQLIEELSAAQHDSWSNWQRYLHSVSKRKRNGDIVIPASLVDRWERQIATEYKDLSESEKESDRKEVKKYFRLIEAYIAWVISD
jgi:hypothetical protein